MGDATVGKILRSQRFAGRIPAQQPASSASPASSACATSSTELTIGAQNETDAYENFSWNLMVLRHEADQLGIEPTTEEVADGGQGAARFPGREWF